MPFSDVATTMATWAMYDPVSMAATVGVIGAMKPAYNVAWKFLRPAPKGSYKALEDKGDFLMRPVTRGFNDKGETLR